MGWLRERRERKVAEREEREERDMLERRERAAARLASMKRRDGEQISADLFPASSAERLKVIPQGKRRRMLWVNLEVHADEGTGRPMVIATRPGGEVYGWIKYGSRRRALDVWNAVTLDGVNIGLVAVTLDRDSDDTRATAELFLGPHDYEPHFDL